MTTPPYIPPPVPKLHYRPPASGPTIIHEDLYQLPDGARGGFVGVDKPSGLLSVPGIGPEKADCVRSRVLAIYPWATGHMTVHRLDHATSGVLLVALDKATHRNLSVQLERRRMSKRYEALVGGHIEGESGEITVPIRKDMDRRPTQLVDFNQGKPCTTEWRLLAHETLEGHPVSRLELIPHTGRTHQLRIHCADPFVRTVGTPTPEHTRGLAAPILGDEFYPGRPNERLTLHAVSLTFNHPVTGKMLSVCAQMPF